MFLITRSIRNMRVGAYQIRTLIRKYPPQKDFNQIPKDKWNPYQQIIDPESTRDFEEDPLEFRRSDGEPEPIKKPHLNFLDRLKERVAGNTIRKLTIREKFYLKSRKKTDELQAYKDEEVGKLGPDIAAANVIWDIDGAIKFNNYEGFYPCNQTEIKLPQGNDEHYKIEGIDFSNTEIKYEGLRYLNGLKNLRWLSFENCQHFDNWCMDRVSLYVPNLEYINIRGCTELNYNALACFYRFKKLKCVYINHAKKDDLFTYACLHLETEIPGITIKGLEFKKTPKSVFD